MEQEEGAVAPLGPLAFVGVTFVWSVFAFQITIQPPKTTRNTTIQTPHDTNGQPP